MPRRSALVPLVAQLHGCVVSCLRLIIPQSSSLDSSWRGFRRSGSKEDHSRFRFPRQQFHRIVRSSWARFWNEWFDSVQSLAHDNSQTGVFPHSTHLPDPHSTWRAHFASSPSANCVFSGGFFQFLSFRFAPLTSSRESGRFDAPFSQRACCGKIQVPRVFVRRGRPPALHFQSPLSLVASPAPLFLSTSSCRSSPSPPLGSAVWSSHSSSVTVTLPSTFIVPCLRFL